MIWLTVYIWGVAAAGCLLVYILHDCAKREIPIPAEIEDNPLAAIVIGSAFWPLLVLGCLYEFWQQR